MARRRLPIKDLLLLRMNPVVRYLILADIAAFSAVGLLGPIFAIFITDFIEGGGVAVAGAAAAIYALTKSVMQIPAATVIDKICGDKDDFWFLVCGQVAVSLIPLSYLFVSTPTELYITQFFLGLAYAFTFPSFMALFTRYIEKEREATVWGVYYTLVDISSAAAAAIGGLIAATVGFDKVIYAVTIIGLLGTLFFIPIAPELRPKKC